MNRHLPGERAYTCPKCNGMLYVVDSRPTTFAGENTIRRRRACAACDHRFTTFEISEGNLANRLERLERILSDRDAVIAAIAAALTRIRGVLE